MIQMTYDVNEFDFWIASALGRIVYLSISNESWNGPYLYEIYTELKVIP